MDAKPHAAAKKLVYLPRSAGENTSPIMVNARPIIIPAPMPCKPRKMISWFMPSSGRKVNVPAAPQRADVSTNIVAPPRKNHFRPYMSDSLAKIGTASVDVSKYVVETQG